MRRGDASERPGRRFFRRGLRRNGHFPDGHYLVAALAVVVAFAAEYVTWPWLKATPLALFFAPVIVGAVRGGMGPALLATALAVPLCNYFFIAPYGAFSLDPSGIASTLVLVVVSLLIGALTDSVVSRGIAERVRAAETLRKNATSPRA